MLLGLILNPAIKDKKHSPPSAPPSLHKTTTVENQGRKTAAVGDDKNKEAENLKGDKGNDAITAVDRSTSQAHTNRAASSSSNIQREQCRG